MKITFYKSMLLCAAILALAGVLPAEPMAREQISAEARWLMHFDADRFRQTKAGAFVIENLLERQLADAKAKYGFDFGPLFHSIKSITAYGTDFRSGRNQTGVLLVQADPGAVDEIGTIMTLAAADPKRNVKRVQEMPFTIFNAGKDFYVAPLSGGRLILGQSSKPIVEAWQVLQGRHANLNSTTLFKNDAPRENFIFVSAEGLNKKDARELNARLLRKAETGFATLAEHDDQLALSLRLNMENEKAATQLQKLAQGLIDWGQKLKKPDNDLKVMTQSAKVVVDGRLFTLSFEYPVERATAKMAENFDKDPKLKKASSK